ncbi:hypothetical protein MFLO_01155 [Listeria floridensis FSL S10-1187]|uniref:Uncharacterized protein n=1 Tax=Listeria floridensis FSL S10-1187 TaxID=1265817 RepID=A0ABP3B3M4_9LIST|nr:hypothetical protein [Listeria floridensis]EUJ33795.1 hypothetical protein MFLO_01155 [Listeria floridensis FSL S10-1187]
MKKMTLQRIEDLKDEQTKQNRAFEEELEDMQYLGRQFSKKLEATAERLRYSVADYDSNTIPPLSQGFNWITETHDEGAFYVRDQMGDVMEKQDEAKRQYRKDLERYEDELLNSKENREE